MFKLSYYEQGYDNPDPGEGAPDIRQWTETRVAKKLHNDMSCCDGSVDVGTEYSRTFLLIDGVPHVHKVHLHKSDCAYYGES